jgi:hypothetical protein
MKNQTDQDSADQKDGFFGGGKKGPGGGDGQTNGTKPRPPGDMFSNKTQADIGYGVPTKGSYNSTDKGYKTFGTVGQGPNTEGVKDPLSS